MEYIRQLFEFVFPSFEPLSAIRALLGFILVFFLPGFAWTFVLFRQINIMERVALSFGLSFAVVTLSLFALNKLAGVGITGLSSALVIIVVTIIPVGLRYRHRLLRQRWMDRGS